MVSSLKLTLITFNKLKLKCTAGVGVLPTFFNLGIQFLEYWRLLACRVPGPGGHGAVEAMLVVRDHVITYFLAVRLTVESWVAVNVAS